MSEEVNGVEFARLQEKVTYLERQVMFRDQVEVLLKPVRDELKEQGFQLKEVSRHIGELAQQASKNGELVEDILEEKKTAALAAAQAELEKAKQAGFINMVTKWVPIGATTIAGLYALYAAAVALVHFLATAPK